MKQAEELFSFVVTCKAKWRFYCLLLIQIRDNHLAFA
jgi:hypothetical protein